MRRGLDRTQTSGKIRRAKLLSDLKRALDPEVFVHDVIGATNVRVEGDEIVHSCPLPWGLHKNNDQNPSASFNKEILKFNCFTCGGGDIFWYVQNVLDISFDEAVDLLAGQFKTRELTKSELLEEFEQMWKGEEVSYSMPTYSESLLRAWMREAKYLTDRGVGVDTQREMKTGVDLNNRDQFKEDVWIEQVRVTIPHFFGGKLRGWVKRKVRPDQWGPKYKNSPGLPKAETLYGIDLVEDSRVVVVESPMSVLVMRSQGFKNVVATFGAKVKPDQARLLRRFEDVVIFMDNDDAGRQATRELISELENHTKLWIPPNSEPDTDPGDFTREKNQELLSNVEPYLVSEWL